MLLAQTENEVFDHMSCLRRAMVWTARTIFESLGSVLSITVDPLVGGPGADLVPSTQGPDVCCIVHGQKNKL
jgi:hypothetical protein